MAKPNYQYEKRQRDLAKKRKQEEKRQKKVADKAADESGHGIEEDPSNATPPDAGSTAEVLTDSGTGPET